MTSQSIFGFRTGAQQTLVNARLLKFQVFACGQQRKQTLLWSQCLDFLPLKIRTAKSPLKWTKCQNSCMMLISVWKLSFIYHFYRAMWLTGHELVQVVLDFVLWTHPHVWRQSLWLFLAQLHAAILKFSSSEDL